MFFPYSTERQLQRLPWATITLIGLNVIAAAVTWPQFWLLEHLALNPQAFGWWQPLTALFMYAGPGHLIGNMVFLWVFGSHVEDTIGIPKFLLLYFSAGFAADILQASSDLVFLRHIQGGLGASGCIMGLVALFATRFRKVKVNFFYWFYYVYTGTVGVPALYVAIFYFAFDVVFGVGWGLMGVGGGVAHFAHIGGFICGLAWSYGLQLPEEASLDEAREEAAYFSASGAYGAAAAA